MTTTAKYVLVVTLLVSALAAEESSFHSRELNVAPSPNTPSELSLPPGTTVVDYDVWPTGPVVLVLLKDASGSHVVTWQVGDAKTVPLLDLPSGLDARAIAVHPRGNRFFISGKSGAQWIILVADDHNGKWTEHNIYQATDELRRLLVAPRPFEISSDGQRTVESYRIFFAERQPGGEYSTRSITEDGKREYQVVGPAASYVKLTGPLGEDPTQNFTASALPVAFHPSGDILIWQDAKGCFQKLPYNMWNWDTPSPVAGDPCGGSLTVTPNGTTLLHWKRGEAGISVIGNRGRAVATQAADYQFIATPSSTPDGKGVVGLVKRGDRQALAYVPIDVPLADVMNAWMFDQNSEDQQRFLKNAGLFRLTKDDQMYQLYDSESYINGYDSAMPSRPYLVTTDIFWEVLASAYEGTFIVKERQQAMPSFWVFVTAAQKSLQASAPNSRWALAFDAAAESRSEAKATTAEALHIQQADGEFSSSVFGDPFDFTELRPRGHYASTPEMEAYFKAVHYLTTLAAKKGAEDLNSLPADVKARALQWIAAYQGFIAPSRSPLVWGVETFHPPAYALHPLDTQQIFPLSWGFDNEVLLSTVYHQHWPPAEQITGPEGPRLVPSGLDLATALESGYARSLLKTELAEYPPLGPVLNALQRRRPKDGTHGNLYDAWIDALAVQWADNVQFPGVADDSLWKAKRLQTGLASWATLRHATVLVNERSSAEAGEGGFESLVMQPPRGYVEPDPDTFKAIASLLDDMKKVVGGIGNLEGKLPAEDDADAVSEPLRSGIVRRLQASSDETRVFASIAEKELRSEELSDSDYEQILHVGGVVEHDQLVYNSLANQNLALSTPEPMMKIADVAGGSQVPLLEVAVGRPLEWDQIVPYFGRREMVKGSVYSYYEFSSPKPLNDREWAAQVPAIESKNGEDSSAVVKAAKPPSWVEPFISAEPLSCPAKAPF